MFSSKSTDHLAFVSRQLASLTKSEPLDSALKRMKSTCPQVYSDDIDRLQNLLSHTSEPDTSLGSNPYATLSRLMPGSGGSKTKFFGNFVSYVQQSRVLFETYWAGAVSMIWYLVAVCIVAVGVALMYGLFVLPSFSQMFSQFGHTLPEPTQWLFGPGGTVFPLFAVALGVTASAIAWFVVSFHKRIQALEPLPRWPTWVPVVGSLAETYNLGLFLNFTRVQIESDVENSRAVADAAHLTNQSTDLSLENLGQEGAAAGDSSVLTELGIASRLGRFDEELQFQCDQHIGRLSLSLVEARDRFSLGLKLFLYIFVAMLIFAMYLPIFRMGSII